MTKKSYVRLSQKKKRTIIELHRSGEWTGAELSRLFGITAGRVSQLVRDTYGEHEALGVEVERGEVEP